MIIFRTNSESSYTHTTVRSPNVFDKIIEIILKTMNDLIRFLFVMQLLFCSCGNENKEIRRPTKLVLDADTFVCHTIGNDQKHFRTICMDSLNIDTIINVFFINDSVSSFEFFHENGLVKKKGKFLNQTLFDVVKTYDSSGVLRRYQYYLANSIGGISTYSKIFNGEGKIDSARLGINIIGLFDTMEINKAYDIGIELIHSMYPSDSLEIATVLDLDNDGYFQDDTIVSSGRFLTIQFKPEKEGQAKIRGILYEAGGEEYGGEKYYELEFFVTNKHPLQDSLLQNR